MTGKPFRRNPLAAFAVLGVFGALGMMAFAGPAAAAESAVVFAYHRFGESRFPSTSIRVDQFEAHLRALVSEGYAVLPLPEIMARIRAGDALPERTVAITIDDGFMSAYREAWPRLKAAGLPFTLFVATDPVDQRLPGTMSWDQIRELVAAGATIGNHTASHLHMGSPGQMAGPARNAAEIARASARIEAETGVVPVLFAYPYEHTLAVADTVRQAGFIAAFSQHSGVVDRYQDPMMLPRFEINEAYGGIERFRMAAQALPLPVTGVSPEDPLVRRGDNPPVIRLTIGPLPAGAAAIGAMSCYGNGARLASGVNAQGTATVALPARLPPGRWRLNCTLAGPQGRWLWFGRQLFVAGVR